MAFSARYGDGRAAITHAAQIEIGADALTLITPTGHATWHYALLRRADDGNGALILRFKQDTGERVILEGGEAEAALRAVAPNLFRPTAQGVESRALVGSLVAAAFVLATGALVGVPMAAEPIAHALPPTYQDQIGDIAWSQVNALADMCDDSDEAELILNTLASRLMQSANIPRKDEIWISIVDAPIPNAFALPDNSIVVTDDLIALAEHPDEVTGVIAHEIGHIEHRHVMTNVIRNIGVGVFFDVVFGGAGVGQAVAIASVNLAALRYGREDETEADNSGLDYLDQANIDPAALARFFDRISELEHEAGVDEIPTLLASHPASEARAAAARARARTNAAPSLTDAEWRVVRSSCGMDPDAPPEDEEEAPTIPIFGPPTVDKAPPSDEPIAGKPGAEPANQLEGGE
ncbi:putative Zn-dependent protease [alpha proteobacterium U9-1i]|nr:putative Zn-dependent protease [alpha proteobacterium U9-1i]